MGRVLFMRKGETHTAPAKGLPSGFTKLVYIQSSGTQFIDTGFKPNQNTTIAAEFVVLDASNDGAYLYGGGTGTARLEATLRVVRAVRSGTREERAFTRLIASLMAIRPKDKAVPSTATYRNSCSKDARLFAMLQVCKEERCMVSRGRSRWSGVQSRKTMQRRTEVGSSRAAD